MEDFKDGCVCVWPGISIFFFLLKKLKLAETQIPTSPQEKYSAKSTTRLNISNINRSMRALPVCIQEKNIHKNFSNRNFAISTIPFLENEAFCCDLS